VSDNGKIIEYRSLIKRIEKVHAKTAEFFRKDRKVFIRGTQVFVFFAKSRKTLRFGKFS
jgi:hypothetical protein